MSLFWRNDSWHMQCNGCGCYAYSDSGIRRREHMDNYARSLGWDPSRCLCPVCKGRKKMSVREHFEKPLALAGQLPEALT